MLGDFLVMGISNSDVHTLAQASATGTSPGDSSRVALRAPDIFVTYDWSYSFLIAGGGVRGTLVHPR
jgi:hypothetical protein